MRPLSPFVWRRRVGMRDVDAWGVVWYGNYLVYCDEARAHLFRSYGVAPGTFQDLGFIAPVVKVESRYHAPARFDEEIDVHVRLSEQRGSRLTFSFAIRRTDDETLLSRHETTLILTRLNGDVVYLLPAEFEEPVRRLQAEQPES